MCDAREASPGESPWATRCVRVRVPVDPSGFDPLRIGGGDAVDDGFARPWPAFDLLHGISKN